MALYIGGALLFGIGIWAIDGPSKAEEFLAGYLLEQSLSVDNLFVFILVFNYFKTPIESQAKASLLANLSCRHFDTIQNVSRCLTEFKRIRKGLCLID